MKIKQFDWNNSNIDHIARHNVTPDEAEEAFLDALFRKGRDGRLLVYGLTDAGRFLLVVAAIKPGGVIRVITARDMTNSERRYFLREKGYGNMTKKVPNFRNEEEEALFWDEHDTTKFVEDFEPVEIELSQELEEEILKKRELKKPITLRLEPSQIDAVKKIAVKKGLPYQTLIRLWITERIRKEII